MKPEDLYDLIEKKIGDDVNGYTIVDGEGLRLEHGPHINNEKLEEKVLPILTEVQWIVTSILHGVLVEPRYTRQISIQEGEELYHVSNRTQRDSILQQGLTLGTGGNTRLVRKYPPRIFFAKDYEIANKFIDFQCRNTQGVYRDGEIIYNNPLKDKEDFDVWKIKAEKNITFYNDILFPNAAVWTESAFPPDRIKHV